MKIIWNLKCPFHNIPLLTESDEHHSAFCPKCDCWYFKYELGDSRMRQAIINKYKDEKA